MHEERCSDKADRVYSVINRYLGMIIEVMDKNIEGVDGYVELLQHLYPRSSREGLLELLSIHTALQILVNVVVGMYVAGDRDIDSICYGHGLERYGVLAYPLLWWRSGRGGDDLFIRICGDIAQEAKMISAADIAFGNIFDRIYSRLVGRGNRYYVGEYYTPPWVARVAVERASIYSGGLINKIFADPACGSGVFLVQALRVKTLMGEDPLKAFQSIWGIDVNPIAVIISRTRILTAFKILSGIDPKEAPRIFHADFIGTLTGYMDALYSVEGSIALPPIEDQGRAWNLGKGLPRTDIIATNPPWLELNELPRSPWGEHVRRYVRDNIVKGCRDRIPGLSKYAWKGDLSAVFLDLSLGIVGRGGVVGILLPANQSYSGSPSPHGAGKLLTLAVIRRWRASGEILYIGDVFGHGVSASLAIFKRNSDLPGC